MIVSQLVRSPGVYFHTEMDATGKLVCTATIIPNRGAWLEFESDNNEILFVRVDRTRKLPVTVLLRALGYSSDGAIIDLFGDNEYVRNTLEKDSSESQEDALLEIYKRLRPGEPPTVENAQSLLESLYFDSRRYDLASVGRYKLNKKLGVRRRIVGIAPVADIFDHDGKLVVAANTNLDRELAQKISDALVNRLDVRQDDGSIIRVIGNGTPPLDVKTITKEDLQQLSTI